MTDSRPSVSIIGGLGRPPRQRVHSPALPPRRLYRSLPRAPRPRAEAGVQDPDGRQAAAAAGVAAPEFEEACASEWFVQGDMSRGRISPFLPFLLPSSADRHVSGRSRGRPPRRQLLASAGERQRLQERARAVQGVRPAVVWKGLQMRNKIEAPPPAVGAAGEVLAGG